MKSKYSPNKYDESFKREAVRLVTEAGRSAVSVERDLLDVEMKSVYEHSQGRYGSVKITHELKKRGKKYGRNRVANRMRKMDIASKVKKKFKATTNSKHTYPVAPNLLNRNFTASAANEGGLVILPIS